MNTRTENDIIKAYYHKVLCRDYDSSWRISNSHLLYAVKTLAEFEQTNPYLDLNHCLSDKYKLNHVLRILNYYDKNKRQDDDRELLAHAYRTERRLYTGESIYHHSPANYTERHYERDETSYWLELFQAEAVKKLKVLISSCSSSAEQQLLHQDLTKLESLHYVEIPQAYGNDLSYFELAEATAGVTEKVSLVSQGSVLRYLQFLCKVTTNRTEYLERRDEVKLSTEAIVKLPKAGKTTEVQRELIALNIAEILGFNTTKRCMIEYRGMPALFVPFDDIRLLSDYVEGESQTARLGSYGKKYLHYSTIKAVGGGLSPDSTIEDMGLSLATFYLCSDTDAIGGYNQNKALIGDKHLYFFDQVVMAEDKLGLDSRFSMQPIEMIMKHTRHGQGRNRTVIEDSQFERKFESLINLQNNRLEIETMIDHIINEHVRAINKIQSQSVMSDDDQLTMKQLIVLRDDAIKIKKVILRRIDAALDFLPKFTGHKYKKRDENKLLMHAMMLEKLINKPVLYAKDGRGYRNPWTDPHGNKIVSIRQVDDVIELEFSKSVSGKRLALIAQSLGIEKFDFGNLCRVRIEPALLLKINERMIFAEMQPYLKERFDYLKPIDLNLLAESYPKGNWDIVLKLIQQYQTDYKEIDDDDDQDIPTRIKCMEKIEQQLKTLYQKTTNKGFVRHVQRKLQYDIQQKIQQRMGQDKPELITNAFRAAVKLDRLSCFNQVCQQALLHGKVTSKEFHGFLRACIELEKRAGNYSQTQQLSQQFVIVAKGGRYAMNPTPRFGGCYAQSTSAAPSYDRQTRYSGSLARFGSFKSSQGDDSSRACSSSSSSSSFGQYDNDDRIFVSRYK